MKNRYWISKQSIYDFLCHLNEKDVKKCVVTLCNKKIDEDRCIQHNKCKHFSSNNGCTFFSSSIPVGDYIICQVDCFLFAPDCEKCIADYLNEER